MESSNEKSTEDSNNEKNSSNPKQPGEADSGASCSGNQTKQYKGSSKTFKIAELKAISVCINRQSKNFSQQDIKRAIEDPSLITIKRRPGEGSVPLFDRKEVEDHINLPLENDSERPKKKRRKRSKSRDRSSSPYRRKHRSPYSTSPDREYRSHRSRRSELAEERRRRRARSHSRSTSSEKRHYVSKRPHTGDRKNDCSSSSDSSDENSRSKMIKISESTTQQVMELPDGKEDYLPLENDMGEGSVPLFDRKEVKNHINLPLEIDLERPKKKRRKRSKSRDRSSSPYRRKHRSPYSTSPDRKYRSHRSRRSESAEERRRRRARSHSRSTSSEKRHYVSKRSHTGDRKNDHSSSSDSSDENSRSERRRHYRDRRERDSRYYQDIIPPREMMMAHHGPMMPRMMMNPMMPWGYPPYPRPPVRGMPPFRPPWETMRPTIVYNSRPPKPVAIEASTSENSTNVVPTTTTS